jgi:hypothetical protein
MSSCKRSFFCKVCKDSGKSDAIFMSHNVKDAKGVVLCPTLLGQACLRCNRKGHTASYCTFQQQKQNSYNDGNESEEHEQTKAEIRAQRPQVHVIDFPVLSENLLSASLSANVTLRPHQKSWARVAAEPAPVRVVTPTPDQKQTTVLKKALGIPATAAAVPAFVPSAQIALTLTAENLTIMRQTLKKSNCCWADFEEDD